MNCFEVIPKSGQNWLAINTRTGKGLRIKRPGKGGQIQSNLLPIMHYFVASVNDGDLFYRNYYRVPRLVLSAHQRNGAPWSGWTSSSNRPGQHFRWWPLQGRKVKMHGSCIMWVTPTKAGNSRQAICSWPNAQIITRGTMYFIVIYYTLRAEVQFRPHCCVISWSPWCSLTWPMITHLPLA